MNKTDTIIITCTSLARHVKVAQEKMGTDYRVVGMARELHYHPKKMREKILDTLEELPESIKNVLVGMGLCGGSWDLVVTPRRIVIPRMDDCITMLLHTDDTLHPILKEKRHFYFRDSDRGKYSFAKRREEYEKKYGPKKAQRIMDIWFSYYTNANIIDTGAYDCREEGFMQVAKMSAAAMDCELGYVKGSNRVLEKLISGQWDEQFLVIEPGRVLLMEDFH